MLHNILAIVGPSGSGKTTIALAMQRAGIPQIVSYTTRPTRPGETNGVEHFFVSDTEADAIIKQHTLAAYTEISGYRYFTITRQLCYMPDDNCQSKVQPIRLASYIVDERGLQELMRTAESINARERKHQFNIVPVYVDRELPDRVRQCGWERVRRDAQRTELPQATYTIRVINNAPSLSALESWSYAFSVAMGVILHPVSHADVHPSTLYTSDSDVAHIINTINKVQFAEV